MTQVWLLPLAILNNQRLLVDMDEEIHNGVGHLVMVVNSDLPLFIRLNDIHFFLCFLCNKYFLKKICMCPSEHAQMEGRGYMHDVLVLPYGL